jgi:hypothetical protein
MGWEITISQKSLQVVGSPWTNLKRLCQGRKGLFYIYSFLYIFCLWRQSMFITERSNGSGKYKKEKKKKNTLKSLAPHPRQVLLTYLWACTYLITILHKWNTIKLNMSSFIFFSFFPLLFVEFFSFGNCNHPLHCSSPGYRIGRKDWSDRRVP